MHPTSLTTFRERNLLRQLLERLVKNGELAPMPTTTLRDVYAEWIRRREARRIRNIRSDRRNLEKHVLPVLGDIPLHEIRVRHIRDWIDDLSASHLAPRTVRLIYRVVHKLFADLVVEELLAVTPCMLTKDQLPKERDKNLEWRAGAVFTRDEVELLISDTAIPDDRRTLNAIKLLAGLRFGEAAGLRWRDLDQSAQPLTSMTIARSYENLTKTQTMRLVPVHPVLAELLAEWRARGFVQLFGRAPNLDDLIVPSRRGVVRSRFLHRTRFHEDLFRIGLRRRRVHDTRRTLITLARIDGARPDVLEQITHAPGRGIIDLYTSLPWPTLCEAIGCIKVRRLEAEEVRGRRAAIAAIREGTERARVAQPV